MDKYIGKRLDGRYEIHELIGVGGMAVVYRAHDIIDDRTVAIKILKDEYLNNDEFIRRFKNESKAIAILSHPNIVKVYDVSFGDKIQYIVMEYINGITLKEYIKSQGVINTKEAISFISQILKALQHAHEKGIIHRDIKPQNVILLPDGTIKVTDFGIARFSRNETKTMTSKAIGSVHYIAPEQARGDLTDEKSDIYSVGVMLYEMITGELPFEADSAVSVAIMQLQTQPKLPQEINPEIPQGLQKIILKAMQKEPHNRFDSAFSMLRDLERFEENPDIKFDYKYITAGNLSSSDDVNIANSLRSEPNYGDGYEYEEQKTEKNKKKKTIMVISGIAAAVLLFGLIFGIIALTKSCGNGSYKDVDVPNFIGMKLSEVQNNKDYKFNWKIDYVYDPNRDEGIIVDQDPKSSTKKVKENATITLKVNSSGALIAVPSVKGLTEDAAKAKLDDAGLTYEVINVADDDIAAGMVKSSDPQAGTKIAAKTVVKLYVSKGPTEKKVTVPDIIGKTLSEAKSQLSAKGLTVGEVTTADSDKPKDTVLETNPLPGVEVNQGSTVKITVSSGTKKEKTIDVSVDLPTEVSYEITISTYIDGVFNSEEKVVPAYNGTYTLHVTGNTGTKTVNVNLNSQKYRIYSVNFDSSSDNVKIISKYPFTPSSSGD